MTSSFDFIDLHDSPVRTIVRSGNDFTFAIDFARLCAGHPQNHFGETAIVSDCTFIIAGVSSSIAKVFKDDIREFIAHPDPDAPIDGDLIEATCTMMNGTLHLHLAGFYGKSEWVEWDIIANSVDFQWKSSIECWRKH